jgi:hypothetical protein
MKPSKESVVIPEVAYDLVKQNGSRERNEDSRLVNAL